MGMFDSLFDGSGHEWQTKAYDCLLDEYRIGDPVPVIIDAYPDTYQVEVLGGPGPGSVDSFATVRGNHLHEVPAGRDPSLPLINFSGHLVNEVPSC